MIQSSYPVVQLEHVGNMLGATRCEAVPAAGLARPLLLDIKAEFGISVSLFEAISWGNTVLPFNKYDLWAQF